MICIAGDWAPGIKSVDLSRFRNLTIANLEGPVMTRNHSAIPLLKAGPSLFSCELPAKDGQFIFSLANNHFMDFGVPGLEASENNLNLRGFQSCGAGRTIFEARRPIFFEDNECRIGLISCCEAQFGIARRNHAGVAEFGPWIYQTIRDLRKHADVVIVSVHAAVEDSPWPSPYIRDLYHSFIDAGAGVVHGHHSHVPQGYERYGDGVIFYGMGNFAVDPDKWTDYPNGLWSSAAEMDLGSKQLSWKPLTIEIRYQPGSDTILIEESTAQEYENHKLYLEKCNQPFDNPVLFDALWQEVAIRAYVHYGSGYMGFSPKPKSGFRANIRAALSIIKHSFLSGITPSSQPGQSDYLVWYHMIAGESHRQMLVTALGVLAGEIEDQRNMESCRLADEMMPWSIKTIQK